MCHLSFPPSGLTLIHTLANHAEQHIHTHVCTPHMQAPTWKTGSQHRAISSTSGCSMRGNEVYSSQSSGRTVGSSIGGKTGWLTLFTPLHETRVGLVNEFILCGTQRRVRKMTLSAIKRCIMIEVHHFICRLCVMQDGIVLPGLVR